MAAGAPQRYVRSGGISGSARIALETTLMTLIEHPGARIFDLRPGGMGHQD